MRLTREEMHALYARGEDAVVGVLDQLQALVRADQEQITTLSARVKELEDQANTNSRNSSKPPSSDGYGRPPRSLRQKSGKTVGGQPGHAGNALHLSATPDRVLVHGPAVCAGCQHALDAVPAQRYERRQVLDVPPLRWEVSEHRAEEKRCPMWGKTTTGEFPPEVTVPVQYGARSKALAVYLVTHHLLPYERTHELLDDLFGQGMTQGTVCATVTTCAAALQDVEAQIKAALTQAEVMHKDETGVRVAGQRHWLHSASTAQLTHYVVHPKRGSAAMTALGILPAFGGTSVHDGLSAYQQYACGHGLCNAHHLRELTAIEEHDHQPWATTMKDLLMEIKTHIAVQQAQGAVRITPAAQQDFAERYGQILQEGCAANPPPAACGPPKRGRPKQSKAKNLLDRLQQQQHQVLAFMADWRVPCDNNLAERDLRMVKVQQKVSGCFRTAEGAAVFCRIRGYLSTLRKQGIPLLPALQRLFLGAPLLPNFAAS